MLKKRVKFVGMIFMISVLAVTVTACSGIDVGNTYELTLKKVNEGTLEPEVGTYEYGEEIVDLTASPADNFSFSYWEGDVDDSDSAETSIYMDEDKEVTAHFLSKTKTLHNFENENNERVWSVEFSPDNSKLIAGGDYPLKIWNLDNNDVLEFDDHGKEVYRVVFSPNGEMVASSGADDVDTTLVWNPDTGDIEYTLNHDKGINSLSFSSDNSMVAAGGNNESLLIWDLNDNGNEIAEIFPDSEIDRNKIYSVGFFSDNKRVYAGVEDETVKIWDIDDPDFPKVNEFTDHTGPVVSIDISSDDSTAVSSARGDLVRVWDVDTGEALRTFDHGDTAESVNFSADDSLIVSAGGDSVKLWEAKKGNLIADYKGHDEPVWAGDISSADSIDEIMIASGDNGGEIEVWELE